MPICCICQGDGVLSVNSEWYCTDHLEDAVTAAVLYTARIRGWDEDEAEAALRDWMAS
jgi:hypothetical protein